MMKSRITRFATRAASAVAAAAFGLGLAACSGGSEPAVESAASESASTSPTTSPSPAELSPKAEAIEQAEPLVREFFRLSDESKQDPEKFQHEWFGRVAIGSAENYLEKWHAATGEQGLHQVGTSELVSIEVSEVDLTFKPKVTPPEIPYVEFTVCYDVTGLDIVDETGKSVVSPSRKDRGVAQVGVANYEYPDGPWLVDIIDFPEGKTC